MIKKEKYIKVIEKLKLVLKTDPELSINAKMSMISSILHHSYRHWLFCGFYNIINKNILEIGPYQGEILPCSHIEFSRGVCGEAVTKKKSIVVNDVSKYDNYISCDSKTKSEIVIPILKKDSIIGVLDIDSCIESDFDKIDLKFLTEIIYLI